MPVQADSLISTCGIVVDRTMPGASTIRCQDLRFVSPVDRTPCVCRPRALCRPTVVDRVPAFHDALVSECRATKLEIACIRHGLLLAREAERIAFPFAQSSITTSTFQDIFASCFFEQMDGPTLQCDACWRSLGGKVLVDAALRDSSVSS